MFLRFQSPIPLQLLICATFLLAYETSHAADVPGLTVNGADSEGVSNDGKVILAYAKEEAESVVVEQATVADFSDTILRYQGPDAASVLTGLAEGDYYFRARFDGMEKWSPVVHVRVEFMNRGRLILLFLLGFVVVALTAGAILIGQTRSPESVS